MDVEALIAPLSDEDGARAGEDLSYSDERTLIEAPFQLDAGGNTVEERQWRDSIRAIQAQAAETRDLWLAVYLARAGAKVGDLQIVADGTALLAGLLETLWHDVHPTLEEADFVGRKSPCDSLTKIREFLAPLRAATVWEHRLGVFSGADLERFAAEGDAADGYGQFRAAIGNTDAAALAEAFGAAVARLDAIRDALHRADAVLVAHAGSDTGTNFTSTYDVLASLRRAVLPYAGLESEPTAGTPDAEATPGAAPGAPALSGRVNSREDVVKALDAIADYYRAREPGSPVPVLLKRARHWVGMDFLEVLDDLVPDSMTEAKRVLVSKLDEPEADSPY